MHNSCHMINDFQNSSPACVKGHRHKPLVGGSFQQGTLGTCSDVGKFSEPVGVWGATELLVRNSCCHLKHSRRPLVLLHFLQVWDVI